MMKSATLGTFIDVNKLMASKVTTSWNLENFGKIFLIESVDRTIRAERGGAMSADRFNVNYSFSKNWELLESKYVGTGHPDLTK